MRKPLVVVCVTASVVLLAGAVAATTAGAETTPDGTVADAGGPPGVPDDLPPGIDGQEPDLSGVPDLDPPVGAPPPAHAAPPAGPDTPAAPQRPGGTVTGGPATVPPPHKADKPAAQDPKPAHAAVAKPAAKPAAEPDDGADGSRRDVTPGSVSGSTGAPVQQQVLALVNENRREGGCEALTLDRRLITAANRHAADMARRGYFAHESPNGEGAGDRVEDAGYDWKRYGENIARGVDSAYEVVDGWMHSPEHRENIMDCQLHQMGIGLAFDSDETPYWVQDFATPH
ncbi:CAP domain-containing protein [Actinoplanes sp. NPDC049265]|uniref:CAP domain-containing protein n=1 Tax=Actinoplanes sp. NPDC049265 TaxID=3363902 RepID=UPI0037145E6F